MPKISVIIPVYNSEKYLRKCVDSILNQTLKEIEVIIINDGSTDSSVGILNNYERKYSKIIKVIHQKNKGQASARNKGLDIASGEYISFVDSDDWIDQNMYYEMYNKAKQIDADIIVSDMMFVYYDVKKVIKINYPKDYNKIKTVFEDGGSPCNKIYKAKMFETIRFPEGLIHEDFAIVPILLYEAKVIFKIDYPFYNYLQRQNSTMDNLKKIEDNFFDILKVLDLLYDYFSSKGKKEILKSTYIMKSKIQVNYILRGKISLFKKIKSIQRIMKPLNQRFSGWRKDKLYLSKFQNKGKIYKVSLYFFDIILSKIFI